MVNYSANVQLALDILKDEVKGDVGAAMHKMGRGYTMTWVYKKGETLFPISQPDPVAEVKEAYAIKGRKYEIKNIAEGEHIVIIELIESYPDPKTGEIYRTPMTLVLEIKDGKIARGRHYCDPDISWLNLKADEIEQAYPHTPTKLTIE